MRKITVKLMSGFFRCLLLLGLISQLIGSPTSVHASTNDPLPTRVDLSPEMPPVENQGNQGSCVGWAIAYYYKSFHEKRERGWAYTDKTMFSPGYIYNQYATSNTSGMSMDQGMQLLTTQGVAPWASFPYNQNDWQTQPSEPVRSTASMFKSESYQKIEDVNLNGLDTLRSLLANGEPFVMDIPIHIHGIQLFGWDPLILGEVPTVIDVPSSSDLFPVLNYRHAITVVGYDDTTFRFKFVNSWGANWGEGGYGYLTYAFVVEMGTNAYYMVDKMDQPPSVGNVTGQFFRNPTNGGAFTATPTTPEAFRQNFPVINFNPPAGTIPCTNNTGVGVSTRPFTAVVPQLDGSCLTIPAAGNGLQAGVGELGNFQAVFSGSFEVAAGSRVNFNFFSDDGWILSIGPNVDGVEPAYVSGPMLNPPAAGPFTGFTVVGSYNTGSPPTRNDLIVDFPAQGTYPFELDYTEGYLGELALTLKANTHPLSQKGINVFIGDAFKGNYFLTTNQSTRQRYTGVDNGPVKVVNTHNTSMIASERMIYKVSGVDRSYSELMALPDHQIDMTYWLPWYNNIGLDTQLRFANVSNSTASVHVYIGEEEMTGSPFTVDPGESTRKSFPGIDDGPVKIESNVNIVAAERVIYKVNGLPTSFSEMLALPNEGLDDKYWLPWYNNVGLDSQLRFANVSLSTATVHVFIGGEEMEGSPFTLAPGASTRKSFPGVDNGPVEIRSTQNIVAAERVIYKANGIQTSTSTS
jgi:hypothetical protein